MYKNPFSQVSKEQDGLASRRRSTRIDFVTTVLLSGKDASGTAFREFTQTAIVNVHGCKVRTSYRILVGMLLTLECPQAGTSGKGVCVKVWDSAPGVAGHEIAVQLIKPQNLWAVPNPPSDWEIVTNSMVHGQVVPDSRPARLTTPGAPVAPVPAVATVRSPAPRPASVPVASAMAPAVAVPSRPAKVSYPTAEQRLAELEQHSTKLMESALEILRGQVEELTRNSLEEFRQQVDALLQDADLRQREGLQQSYEELSNSLIGLREDLMEQMASRSAEMARSAEEILRTPLGSQSGGPEQVASPKPPKPAPEE
jgi:hypothetical protein